MGKYYNLKCSFSLQINHAVIARAFVITLHDVINMRICCLSALATNMNILCTYTKKNVLNIHLRSLIHENLPIATLEELQWKLKFALLGLKYCAI